MMTSGNSTVWSYRGLYLLICLTAIFANLLPINPGLTILPQPDFIYCVTIAWVIRRPEFLPPAMIALTVLLADFLLQRPPGLWAAIVVLVAETLRSQHQRMRDNSFAVEWAMVSVLLCVAMIGYHLAHVMVLLDGPGFASPAKLVLVTVIAYPLVVLLSNFLLGIRKIAPGEVDTLGRRL